MRLATFGQEWFWPIFPPKSWNEMLKYSIVPSCQTAVSAYSLASVQIPPINQYGWTYATLNQYRGNIPWEGEVDYMDVSEAQQILGDPEMRKILQQMQVDRRVLQEYLKNQGIMQKVIKLSDAGQMSISYK